MQNETKYLNLMFSLLAKTIEKTFTCQWRCLTRPPLHPHLLTNCFLYPYRQSLCSDPLYAKEESDHYSNSNWNRRCEEKTEPIPGAAAAGVPRTRGAQMNARNWKTERATAPDPGLPMNSAISQVHQCDCPADDEAWWHG